MGRHQRVPGPLPVVGQDAQDFSRADGAATFSRHPKRVVVLAWPGVRHRFARASPFLLARMLELGRGLTVQMDGV